MCRLQCLSDHTLTYTFKRNMCILYFMLMCADNTIHTVHVVILVQLSYPPYFLPVLLVVVPWLLG